MKERVMVFLKSDLHAFARVRNQAGLLAAEEHDALWLRGIPPTAESEPPFALLPAVKTWLADSEGRLFVPGQMTPETKMPELNWISVKKFIEVELPVAGMSGQQPEKIIPCLAWSEEIQKPFLLCTNIRSLGIWMEDAPAHRFSKLEYAVSQNGKCLIIGNPFPPVPGSTFWKVHNLLIPSGMTLYPESAFNAAKKFYATQDGSYMMIHPDEAPEEIPSASFVGLTRSGVRKMLRREDAHE